jgi:hypothetical protein
MDLLGTLQSILKGIGNTMGGVALMLVFGAMLGRLLDESGAAQAIATRFIDITGESTSSSRWRRPGCSSGSRCTTTPAFSSSSRSSTPWR